MDRIIEYLKEKYKPIGTIVYGSFSNGTNNQNSDFDALVIYDGDEVVHDNSIVSGIELDVFVYPKSWFEKEYDIQDYIQIFNGTIINDDLSIIHKLKNEVEKQVLSYKPKSKEQNKQSIAWLEKMLKRTSRKDVEGLYRMYWLLVDSLEIYFDLIGKYYFGPKKAIKEMNEIDSKSADIYYNALKDPKENNLTNWVKRLKDILEKSEDK